ncbi:hypothetical protein BLNAU_16374 [Blattamonas nauphoetae]|uniref:Uncharacterized protein n=1 Tax=Blattamonas nauphoetae TaxID=2049346 RepID=A0ABQ9X9Z0_9EUKA|nr:hypothetical protein BLNAU_16374 [Blattamonas nauphoetae]
MQYDVELFAPKSPLHRRPVSGSIHLSPYTKNLEREDTLEDDEQDILTHDDSVIQIPNPHQPSPNPIKPNAQPSHPLVTNLLFDQVFNPPRPKTAPGGKIRAKAKGAAARPQTRTAGARGKVKAKPKLVPPSLDIAGLVNRPASMTNRLANTLPTPTHDDPAFTLNATSNHSAVTLTERCFDSFRMSGIPLSQDTSAVIARALIPPDIAASYEPGERLLKLPDALFGCRQPIVEVVKKKKKKGKKKKGGKKKGGKKKK